VEPGGCLELVVEDDGVGPRRAAEPGAGGFGLLGLRERVELLGGSLAFDARPGGGSRLAVRVPRSETYEPATA
jgi:signal transduction histidine kinase